MLTKLSIDNYALIDKSVIDFQDGFTVITGETGAGKSIMLDALSLLTGARADSKAMGNKERKTIVEAFFKSPNQNIKSLFTENNLDWDENELILRREISTNGKSRGFINDTPVNLNVLGKISEKLIEIHSQHSNSLLNDPHEQLSIIDAYGGNESLLSEYKRIFVEYVGLRNEIKKIRENIIKGKENQEFIKFRLEQLDKLKPKRGELVSLEREADILSDADRIKSSLDQAKNLLGGTGESGIKIIQNAVSEINGIDLDLLDHEGNDNILERLNFIKIELRDIVDSLESYSDKIISDPQRYEKVQKRIESLYELMKRFKVKDEDELVTLHENLKNELSILNGGDTDISKMEMRLKEMAKTLKDKAEALTQARIKSSKKFASEISNRIMPLGLPNIKFDIEINKGKLTSEGQDSVTFYCSFNKNHPAQPLAGIASGGEISRVMLGIKSVIAEKMNLPTIILDEIDTGVSGEIAHKMGTLMKEMAKNIQVVSVTHLPQVAAHGDTHLKVYKADENEKTVSHIRVLNEMEREQEIAGMLSGTKVNPIALENARILLNNN